MNERKRKYRIFLCCCLVVAFVGMGFLIYETAKEDVPDEIHVYANQQINWEEVFHNPLIRYDSSVEASRNGSYRVECRLLGMIPLKTVKVSLAEEQEVYVGGSTVGIYMETKGVLVIDSGEIRDMDGISRTPAEHIIQPGDYIRSVDGEELENKKQLIGMVSKNQGEPMEMEVMRRNEMITLALTPVRTEDGTYKLGIWVRDNIQGIGTLTFTTQEGEFAALGHGISDVDTGERLEISKGELYEAKILSVQKGAVGSPGELRGVIDYEDSRVLGQIEKNNANGISGTLKKEKQSDFKGELYPIGLKQEIQTGTAIILCDVGEGIQEYEIEITEIHWNAKDSNKSFVIHAVDERLQELTGGIVQGMSGSPVIQNGRLVGAVTHVLVNDPTRGYGIFIENMLDAAE